MELGSFADCRDINENAYVICMYIICMYIICMHVICMYIICMCIICMYITCMRVWGCVNAIRVFGNYFARNAVSCAQERKKPKMNFYIVCG